MPDAPAPDPKALAATAPAVTPPATQPAVAPPPASSPGPAPLTLTSASPPVVKVKDMMGRIHSVEVKIGETVKQFAERVGKDFARFHGTFTLSHEGEVIAAENQGEEATKILSNMGDKVIDLVKDVA